MLSCFPKGSLASLAARTLFLRIKSSRGQNAPPLMSTKNRREREKTAKRQHILETAKSLFEKKGIMNVTMNDIAAACEYSIGSLYLSFKNKEDIYLELAIIGAERIDELLKAKLTPGIKLSPVEVDGIVEEFLTIFEGYGYYFDVLNLSTGPDEKASISSEGIEALSSKIMSSIFQTSAYFVSVGERPENLEEVAVNTTFAVWAYLLGLAQLTGKGRGSLLDPAQRKSLIRYVSTHFSNDLMGQMRGIRDMHAKA